MRTSSRASKRRREETQAPRLRRRPEPTNASTRTRTNAERIRTHPRPGACTAVIVQTRARNAEQVDRLNLSPHRVCDRLEVARRAMLMDACTAASAFLMRAAVIRTAVCRQVVVIMRRRVSARRWGRVDEEALLLRDRRDRRRLVAIATRCRSTPLAHQRNSSQVMTTAAGAVPITAER